MIILNQEKPPLDELVHFGVKGMKWGVRKTFPKGGRPTGGTADRILFGKKGTAAIQRRVARGMSPRNARILSSGRLATRAILATWGALSVRNLVLGGVTNAVLAKNTAKFTNAGQKEVLAIAARSASVRFAKKRGGVFVITTL